MIVLRRENFNYFYHNINFPSLIFMNLTAKFTTL